MTIIIMLIVGIYFSYYRKATRSLVDNWLLAHSISQPPGLGPSSLSGNGGVVTTLVAATGTIAASTVTVVHTSSSSGDIATLQQQQQVCP